MGQKTSKYRSSLHRLLIDLVTNPSIRVDQQVINNAYKGKIFSISRIADIFYYDYGQYEKAMTLYKVSASKGDPYSQLMIGYMYHLGEGVSINYKRAMKWYLKAHNKGHYRATGLIGIMYFYGQGVPRNYSASLKWHVEAAQRGDAIGQCMSGFQFEYGFGTTPDKKYALVWYIQSAKQGISDANKGVVRLKKQGIYIEDDDEY